MKISVTLTSTIVKRPIIHSSNNNNLGVCHECLVKIKIRLTLLIYKNILRYNE